MRQPRQENRCCVGKKSSGRGGLAASVAAFDPNLAVLEEFLLPDGNDLLQFVDSIVTGIKSGSPMRRRHDHGDAGFADLHMPQPMDDRDSSNIPGLAHEYPDLL